MNELINVSFEDRTNYTVFDSSDVVGQPIDHFWGPVDELKVMSRAQFVAAYPLSVPMSTQPNLDFLKSYVNIYRAFDAGAALVEVFRPQGTNTYTQFNLEEGESTNPEEVINTYSQFNLLEEGESSYHVTNTTSLTQFSSTSYISIALKYPGDLSRFMFGYDKFKVSIQVSESLTATIKVLGITDTEAGEQVAVVEEFVGGFDKTQLVDDNSFYIEDVVSESSFISCKVNTPPTTALTEVTSSAKEVINTYSQFNLEREEGESSYHFTNATSLTQFSSTSNISIALKYPGVIVPITMSGFDKFKVSIQVVDSLTVTIKVLGITDTEAGEQVAVVEQYEGGFDKTQLVDDKSFYIEDVVSESSFISCKVNTPPNEFYPVVGVVTSSAKELPNTYSQFNLELDEGDPTNPTNPDEGDPTNPTNPEEGDPTNELVMKSTTSLTQFSSTSYISIALKYPGDVPKSLFNYDTMSISVEVTANSIVKIEVIGTTNAVETIVEQFEGGFDRSQIVDSQPYYIEDVVSKSKFIACKVNNDIKSVVAKKKVDKPAYTHTAITPTHFAAVYNSLYEDTTVSTATILLDAIADSTLDADGEIPDALQSIASTNYNRVALVGFPTDMKFDKATIKTYKELLLQDKFSLFLAGREVYRLLNTNFILDCTAGWAGRMCAVAKDVNINQLPSAKAYGRYPGSLIASLTNSEVIELHKEGVNSVHNTSAGPQIFGVRSMHPRQLSYYGKANISRVLSLILKNVLGAVDGIMHTATAADEIQRSSFEVSLNTILSNFIASRDIGDESNASVSAELNTDANTNGGEILNIELAIRFYKLVETVTIKVIATDSSVTVEF